MVLKYKTEDMTATAGKDYEGGDGEIVFEHGETTKTLEIVIYDDQVKSIKKALSVNPICWKPW